MFTDVQLEFYTAFKTKNVDLVRSLTSFDKLKPWWVKRLRMWNTCCCRYHQELTELMIALDIMRTDRQGIHSHCQCDCVMLCGGLGCTEDLGSMCKAHLEVYERLTNLWTSILCQKEELSMWHKRDCLIGKCVDCGIHLLRICPQEMTSEQIVKWKSIGYKVVGTTEEGTPRKAATLEYKEINYLKPKLQAFVLHNYVASWQDYQFKELLSSVPPSTLISCIDFSENYTLKVQNEIQSMHWHNDQVTILVHITYRLNPTWDSDSNEPLLLKEIHYYLSDDRTHDSLYVQHCLMLNWEHVKEQGFTPINHIVWSDGCSGQFKSARAWYFISRYPKLTSSATLLDGCQMSWNYFGSGHGKGEVDGASALLKREIRMEQLKPDGRKLQSAAEIVQFLNEQAAKDHAGPRGSRAETSKFFWLIPKCGLGSVDRSDTKQAERVPGSMANHQCRSVTARDPTLLQYRHLSCFCYVCLGYETQHTCYQIDHVPDFTLHRLRPKASFQARRLYDADEEIEAGTGGEWIADGLCVGDNVAVRAPAEQEPWWLMIVVKATYIVEEAFTDPDENTYVPGDVVFDGIWYERLKEGSRTYLLRNDREPSTVYSHVVLTSKFSLPPIAHPIKSRLSGFELKVDVKEIIDEALRGAVLLD